MIKTAYQSYTDTGSDYSSKAGSAFGTFHEEYLGKGDLLYYETNTSTDGPVAEWDRTDTGAEYTGAFVGWLDIDSFSSTSTDYSSGQQDVKAWLAEQAEDAMTESDGAGIVLDSEYLPIFGDSYGTATHTSESTITAVDAFHLGDNVYIGGGMDHIDFVWDDSADAPYWAFNSDMDNGATPTQADDHYGVIGYDKDGDGDLWETTDVFDLDKIALWSHSADFLTQDDDASSDYYFKITPVTYANSTWTVETDNTVTIDDTTNYWVNSYIDLTSNSDFQDINYALIETESAIMSEVIVSGE